LGEVGQYATLAGFEWAKNPGRSTGKMCDLSESVTMKRVSYILKNAWAGYISFSHYGYLHNTHKR
jgi:hypothetical protein